MPHDHNRDWSDAPHWPEVAAAQNKLRGFVAENRLAVLLDLHNPAPWDTRAYFVGFSGTNRSSAAGAAQIKFLDAAYAEVTGPLHLENRRPASELERSLFSANAAPYRSRSCVPWVRANGNSNSVAFTLETPWNLPDSTSTGYRALGRQLGLAIERYLHDSEGATK